MNFAPHYGEIKLMFFLTNTSKILTFFCEVQIFLIEFFFGVSP